MYQPRQNEKNFFPLFSFTGYAKNYYFDLLSISENTQL